MKSIKNILKAISFIFFLVIFVQSVIAQTPEHQDPLPALSNQAMALSDPTGLNPNDLNNWPEGKSPEEIGVRIVNKYLSLPHSHWGKYRKAARTDIY